MTIRSCIWILIAITFFLLPWYYLSSGGFQLVDISIIILFFIFVIRSNAWILMRETSYKWYLLLWCYSVIIVSLDAIIFNNSESLALLWQNLYYLICIIVFTAIFVFMYQVNNKRFYQRLQYLLLLSFIMPLTFFVLDKGTLNFGGRSSLCFDNPNQLGFFALVSMSVLFFLLLLAQAEDIKLNKKLSLLILNITFFFFLLSVTRSAAGMIVMYVVSYFLIFRIKLNTKKSLIFYPFFAVFFILAIGYVGEYFVHLTQAVRGAVGTSGNQDFSVDFYNRAFAGIGANISDSWYFLFGTGQTRRLDGGAAALEYHDNYVAMFSMLGICGLIIYICLNFVILRGLYKRGILYVFPYVCYLFYSAFQFTFRTRVNWLFLSFLILVLFLSKKRNLQMIARKA